MQTFARFNCHGFTRRGRAGTHLRLGLGRPARWVAWRMASRLGRPALLCRRPRLLWLRLQRRIWRLLCAATGPYSLRTSLASDQPLLLSLAQDQRSRPALEGPRLPLVGASSVPSGRIANLYKISQNSQQLTDTGNKFHSEDLIRRNLIE